MAVAVEELTPELAGEYQRPAPAPRPAVFSGGRPLGRPSGSSSSVAAAAWQHLPSGGQKGAAGVGVRLIWAMAAGLLALEVMSLATGRYFTFDLKGGLSSLRAAGSYLGLYPGQAQKLATAAPAGPPAANADKSYLIPSAGTNPVVPGSIVAAQGPNAPGFGL